MSHCCLHSCLRMEWRPCHCGRMGVRATGTLTPTAAAAQALHEARARIRHCRRATGTLQRYASWILCRCTHVAYTANDKQHESPFVALSRSGLSSPRDAVPRRAARSPGLRAPAARRGGRRPRHAGARDGEARARRARHSGARACGGAPRPARAADPAAGACLPRG